MADTFANQKIVYIHKEKCANDFLQVKNDYWRYASKVLKYGTFKLYLELAGNSDGFKYRLSKVGSENNLGISKNVYYRAVEELIEKGYLVEASGNTYNFYTVPYKGQNQDDTSPLQGTPSSPVEGTVNNICPVEGTHIPLEGTVESRRRDKLSRVRVENIDKYIINNIDKDGHCVPLETTPSASSETLPAVAPAEKKQKKRSASKKGAGSIAKKIAKHCCCSAEEIEGIVNNKGYDYDALLRCVENGYINGENHYSKKYWESMDADSVLRDPTYEEYLASMYKSNPNGLDEVKTNNSNRSDNGSDITLSVATENNNDGASMDIDWLADVSSWTVE